MPTKDPDAHKDSHAYRAPELHSGYDPKDEPQMKATGTEPPLNGEEAGADNRGRPAGVTAAGEVVGSGSGAGGKGSPEDFDGDVQAGGGTFEVRHPDRSGRGGDASQHNTT